MMRAPFSPEQKLNLVRWAIENKKKIQFPCENDQNTTKNKCTRAINLLLVHCNKPRKQTRS